jgi:CHAT domain-containing protein
MKDSLIDQLTEIRHRLTLDEEDGLQLFREAFFDLLDKAELDGVEELLSGLKEFPFSQIEHYHELEYHKGILAVERYRWVEAERIFTHLLDAELPPALQAKVLNELGMVYEYLGRWTSSVRTYRQSLEAFQSLGDSFYKAKVLVNLGIAYTRGVEAGDLDTAILEDAITCHQRAREIFRDLHERRFEARAWNELGTVYKALGRWDEALDCYTHNMAICRELGHRHGLGLALNNIGEIYQQQGKWEEASSSFEEALAIMREFDDTYEEADLLSNLAHLLWSQRAMESALKMYDASINVIESIRASVLSIEARLDFFSTVARVYGGKVLLCLETDREWEAFDYVERAKSRALIELLVHRSIRPPRNIPTEWLDREKQLRASLDRLYRAHARDESGPDARECIDQLETDLNELRHRISLYNSEYASFQVVQPLRLAEVQERLPDEMALVEYFSTEDKIIVFVVTGGEKPRVRLLPISPHDLEQACFGVDGRLRSISPGPDGVLHTPWLLDRLYQSLLAPIEGWLEDSRTVVFVPHGLLHYLPLHALWDRKAQSYFLAKGERSVLYSPSATVLLDYCQVKEPSPWDGCLAMAHMGGHLRHAHTEAEEVIRISGGRLVSGEQATRSLLFEEADRYRFLHFSCPALFNPQSPLTSGLLLADGTLDVLDILQHMRLEADLVTLGACDTGLSQVKAGDELMGLIRAFLYAGTPSVLVSLWPVDDLSTRIFMAQFYWELSAAKSPPSSKAAALRRAQLYLMELSAGQVRDFLRRQGEEEAGIAQELQRLIKAARTSRPPDSESDDEIKVFAHPYYWAPFILVGERFE